MTKLKGTPGTDEAIIRVTVRFSFRLRAISPDLGGGVAGVGSLPAPQNEPK